MIAPHILALFLIVLLQGTNFTGNTVVQPVNQTGAWLCLYDACGEQRGGLHYGGMVLVTKDDVTIEGNAFEGGVTAISAYHVKNLTIRNNTFRNQSAWAIYLNGCEGCLVEGNLIENAIRSCPESPDGCESAGLLMLDVHHSRIVRNTCFRSGNCFYANGEGLPSNENSFEDNTCINSPHNCIELTFSRGNILERNHSLSRDGLACLYPFWVGGSDVTFKNNEWGCVKSPNRAENDSRESTIVPTVIRWIKKE